MKGGDGEVSNEKEENPALPLIKEEQDRMTIRLGETEITQTADCIRVRVQCKFRPGLESVDDLNK